MHNRSAWVFSGVELHVLQAYKDLPEHEREKGRHAALKAAVRIVQRAKLAAGTLTAQSEEWLMAGMQAGRALPWGAQHTDLKL